MREENKFEKMNKEKVIPEIIKIQNEKLDDLLLEDDSSLLYDGLHGNYSVLIGGNWRFELVVDTSTGLCTQIRSFLQQMSVIEADLVLPKSEKKDLFFFKCFLFNSSTETFFICLFINSICSLILLM